MVDASQAPCSDPSQPNAGAAAGGESACLRMARTVIAAERDAIDALLTRLGSAFEEATRLLLSCSGRVVVMGMGKSGHIGNKIAATLASTGTPAFFVHPGEASHGDLGMITQGDVVVALSNSGETPEVIALLPSIARVGVPVVAITGRVRSTLAREARVCLDASVDAEACPLGLAPTSSTTVSLVLGDALALALLDARGFSAEDFARSHPGGSLGRRLLVHVSDVMRTGPDVPRVSRGAPLRQALLEISSKGLGITAIVDPAERVVGVFTDGDLRRALDRGVDVHAERVDAVMSRPGLVIQPEVLAAEAVAVMERHRISALPVVDTERRLQGALNMHDLLRAGVV